MKNTVVSSKTLLNWPEDCLHLAHNLNTQTIARSKQELYAVQHGDAQIIGGGPRQQGSYVPHFKSPSESASILLATQTLKAS